MRLTIEGGVLQEIAPLPADERALAEPVAVIPPLVNAHTHLEFSHCSEPLPPPDPFPDWIRSVIDFRTNHVAEVAQAVASGVVESVTSGCALLGEITTSEAGRVAFAENCSAYSVNGVSFLEVLGWSSERIEQQQTLANLHVTSGQDESVSRGLSPHAPYSVHPRLFEETVDLAIRHNVPVAMHLAETLGELELLDRQSGPFADFLKSMQLWSEVAIEPGTTPLRYLQKLAQVPNALAVHGNYFTDQEIRFLGTHQNVAVVYCPRTHAYFGHDPHPWKKLIAANAKVVLGTDGRSSNPDLSIWKELQTCGKLTSLPIWELLPMITTTAAEALGFSSKEFTVRVGQPFHGNFLKCNAESEVQLASQLPDSVLSPNLTVDGPPSRRES